MPVVPTVSIFGSLIVMSSRPLWPVKCTAPSNWETTPWVTTLYVPLTNAKRKVPSVFSVAPSDAVYAPWAIGPLM